MKARQPKKEVQQASMTIRFQDHGQDFLEWDIDDNAVVIESRPFQTWVWSGLRITNAASLKRGEIVRIITRDGDRDFIKYPLEKVTRHKRKVA